MTTLATYNIKGGVGKTATAVNLAYLAAGHGARVLLWDLDPQGAATYYFRVRPRVRGGGKALVRGKRDPRQSIKATDFDGLDLLPADFRYRHLDVLLGEAGKARRRFRVLVELLDREYHYVFLDCPPSISVVSESVFGASDALLVPTIPTTLSLRTLDQLAACVPPDRARPRVLPFFCMVDRRKTLHREICAGHDAAPYPFLRTAIPYASAVERMGIERRPVLEFAHRSPAATAYVHLWREIEAVLRPQR